ncbi:hypothetical protein [Prosthecobacter sp.]|uniref:hypothetical protein n=1 Tax=Prosthecobacter sp. TaxID=1965333 RepID=UPI002AB94D4B|nr:hypothetical protein [Prosthecobacter sp.]MDZ4402406.1 hypothetical protein [Prosthecobacter sp.]
MPANPSRLSRTICIAALGLCLGQALADPPAIVSPSVSNADQTPADFLDLVGQRAKARWRLLFRPPPPTPPTDRGRAALILGSLLGDSLLVWQAADSQQFRNNNQDVLTYCRMLGLGEKLMPRLMAQGKMAEDSEWKDLRHEIVDGHQELVRLLREQRDEDLALMIDLGLWLRILEITSAIVAETAAVELRPLCIGSPAILQEMRDDFSRLSASKREEAILKRIGISIHEISTLWKDADKVPPTQIQVVTTQEMFTGLMQALMDK